MTNTEAVQAADPNGRLRQIYQFSGLTASIVLLVSWTKLIPLAVLVSFCKLIPMAVLSLLDSCRSAVRRILDCATQSCDALLADETRNQSRAALH